MKTYFLPLVALLFFGLSQNGISQIDKVPEVYYDDKPEIFKVNPFSIPASQSLLLSYERALTHDRAVEMRIKFLNIAIVGDSNNNFGIGGDIGYKVKMRSIFNSDNDHDYGHLAHGAYFKGLIGFHYQNDKPNNVIQREYRLVNVGLEVGKQFIFQNSFCLDLYVGLHFYAGPERFIVDRLNILPSTQNWVFGDLRGQENTAISAGIKIGSVFGKFYR